MNAPKIKKGTIETVKTVIIGILVTAIIAFIGGMHFANSQHDQTAQAVKAATAQATAVKK